MSRNFLLLISAGILACATAQAADSLDKAELQFAQANVPSSRDELFGAPTKSKIPAPPPQSKDELFGAPAQPKQAAPKSKDDLFGAPATTQKAPGSKDELFGAPAQPKTPVVAEPASRDGLFAPSATPAAMLPSTKTEALAAESGIKWSGFFDEEIAYTVSDPSHWSRAVSRLQVSGQGQFNGLKYKVSARVDTDPVYYDSNFYPEKVRDDQKFDFFLRENYVDFSAGAFDVRLGRQQIVWGEVVGLFFADVVSGRDMREFILPSFDIMRIPQWAARVEYFEGDFHAEAIWIPVQSLDDIGKPGSDFYPVGEMGAPNAVYRSVDEPSNSLSNSAYGLRLNTLVAGWDMAAFYYRSFSGSPTFYREFDGATPVFTPRNDRIWKAGSTLSKDFGGFVLRAEAVYTDGQTYSVEDISDADGVVRRNIFEYILSFDFSLPNDTHLNVQGFQQYVAGGDNKDIVPEIGGTGFSILLSTKISKNWEPQILWIQDVTNGDRLIRPRVNWSMARNTMLSFGADVFAGPTTGVFGRYGNRDRLYTELRYDF